MMLPYSNFTHLLMFLPASISIIFLRDLARRFFPVFTSMANISDPISAMKSTSTSLSTS